MTIKELALAGELAHNLETGKGTLPTGEDWITEFKYDGWRILAEVGEGVVHFYSRSGKSYDGQLPHVEAELLEHFPAGTWLDGEAVALTPQDDGTILNEWGIAQSVLTTLGANAAASKITYMVFDLIAHAGIDARPLPFGNRRSLLEAIFAQHPFSAVALSVTMPATPESNALAIKLGFEGAVIKRLNAKYASGKRGFGQIRYKPQTTIDAVVMGFQPGKNGFAGLVGAIIFGQHDADGNLVERGKCSGMDMRTRKDITAHPEKWMGRVVEVAHMGVMKDGLRHPQFKRVRDDRSAASVLIHNG